MRKLAWFTLGFASVCAICAYLWLTHSLWIPALCMGAAAAVLGMFSRRVQWLRCLAVLSLGCVTGLLWFQFYADVYLSQAAALDGTAAEVTSYCTDYSYETDYGAAVEGVLLIQGKPVRAKFYMDETGSMEPGDLMRGTFRFRVTTPDGSNEPTAHQGKGIFLLAYQQKDKIQLQKPAQTPVWTFASRLRQNLRTTLDRYFPEDTSGFAKALLLGDRTGIDYEMNTAFKRSGISHIIAVSGLHVAILFTLVNIFCFKRRWLAALLGIPTLVLFAAVVGFTPSITRACIMQCLMMTAMLVNKEYDGPTELAFSCLVMLFANPLVITSVSFQLSVACMIGIFLLRGRIYDYLTGKLITKKRNRFAKPKRWFANSVAVTLSTMVTTTPLSALHFGTVSLLSVLTNLLTLWVVSFIFYGLILVCLLGLAWPAAASVVASMIAWPIRYVIAVAKAIAAFPLASVYTASV